MPTSFTRTTCACRACVQCCKEQPGPLAPGDLDRIGAFLQLTVPDVREKFWASPGALVQNRATGRTWMIGTITPQLVNHRCVFLTADDRCAIHPVAPFGCAYADTHMTEAEWQPRAQWLYHAVANDATYQAVRRALPAATSWRPRNGA